MFYFHVELCFCSTNDSMSVAEELGINTAIQSPLSDLRGHDEPGPVTHSDFLRNSFETISNTQILYGECMDNY